MSTKIAFLFLRKDCKFCFEQKHKTLFYLIQHAFPFQNSERAETQRHLDNLRCQLQNLNCNVDQQDMPVASSTQIEVEGDVLLVDTLRRRMQSLNECNKDLNIRCQRLDAQYKGG